jgi:hypothetical protein
MASMNNILFKDLTAGSPIYALIKADDELQFSEGAIVSIGQQRAELPPANNGSFPFPGNMPAPKTVVDVTYTIEGKNYTDAVEVTACMFPTEKTGAITLVATDKEPVIREIKATLKRAEDYLKSVEVEVPKNKKRVDDCKTLIGLLDTEFAEKQVFENRIKKLEEGNATTNKLLTQILSKLK